eukprot:CAMPEP_0194281510 /NCGR_PEP_ID=MMETSP0169-20130528/20837_1 /TAXON_ID=218684 /ORGANISM="Corethron pennatum, Strain L29A3" /LENGTH=439 /DNA_ID=CAMNT_0039026583 /DNA_START=81 /DNA_END=1397 /DNA_ORIENTATION=-
MKVAFLIGALGLTSFAHGWILTPQRAKCLFKKGLRKGFEKGVRTGFEKGLQTGATGALIVGTATVAGTALVINDRLNNRPTPYEPNPGSVTGQVIVITGGTSGLGIESAKRLAAAGATVVITSRNTDSGEKAVRIIKSYIYGEGGTDVSGVYKAFLDLDDLSSVRAFPDALKEIGIDRIDVLLNNAGVMAIPDRQLTVDGNERTFQSNHLGHFMLTSVLFPLFNREKTSVINVSSDALNFASSANGKGLDIENLNGEKKYTPWGSYGLSKLANQLFTKELQLRADEAGASWLTAVALHPGVVSTDLWKNIVGEDRWRDIQESPFEALATMATTLVGKTAPEGASTQVFLAAGADGNLQKGAFYDDLKEKNLPEFAKDDAMSRALWEKSEELSGVTFSFLGADTESENIMAEPVVDAEQVVDGEIIESKPEEGSTNDEVE